MRRQLSLLFWRVLDPVVKKIEARQRHFNSLRPSTRSGCEWQDRAIVGDSVVLFQDASLQNRATREHVLIGDYCHLRGELVVMGGGRIALGHHTYLGPGSRIWSSCDVRIGNYVLISHLVDIHDTNAHSRDWRDREIECKALFERGIEADPTQPDRAPVSIGDHAWLGLKSTVLKGVRIGCGAIVAAGSVVVKDVPDFTLVAGNPARPVRTLPH